MEIVLGPPGTGKTTYLLQQMESELDRGTSPKRIGYVSFTKRAAREAKDRAKVKFKLGDKDLPWVSTLHSLCFRSLGMKNEEVFEGKKLQEFAKYCGHKLSNYTSWEDGTTFGFETGDRCLFIDNLARVRRVSLREQYDHVENRDDTQWPVVDFISQALVKFKTTYGLLDYTDMLAKFVMQGHVPLDVLFVDEAQDLSLLQWQVVDQLAKGARRVVVAGDDDQAIYRWAGAAVEHFIGLQGDVTVLDHSWRVPPEVQTIALRIVGGIKNRRAKAWAPRDGQGTVEYVALLDNADIDVNEDTLILSRNTQFLQNPVIPMLKRQGILYEYHDNPSVRQSLINAIVWWERLRRGGEVTVDEAEKVYDEMSSGTGYARGHKKLPAWQDRDQLVTMQDLKEAGGLLADDLWRKAFTRRIKPEEESYMVKVLQGGQKLTERPKIRISTMHGAKGAQADHVVILLDIAWRTLDEAKYLPDDEARTWYVAVTRAKQKLTIVRARNYQRSYEL